MSDSIIIKTTGGDIHVSPDTRIPTQEHADKIIAAIDDDTRYMDWMRFHIDRGQAAVYIPSITGVIARGGGKPSSARS